MKRICENCKYEDVNMWIDEPCISCIIETNSNWEEKDDEDD